MTPEQLAEAWGWSEPGPDLVELAERSLRYRDRPVGAIVVELGLASEAAVEAALAAKPADRLTLEWLLPRVDGLRGRYHEILALKNGLPYLTDLEGFAPHPLLEREAVRALCDELGGRLLQRGSGAFLAFTDYDRLADYRRVPTRTRRADPLHQALGEAPHLAVLSPAARAGSPLPAPRIEEGSRPCWDARLQAATPAQRLMNEILDTAIVAGATDIKIDPRPGGGAEVLMRVMGRYTPSPAAASGLTAGQYTAICNTLLYTSGAWDKGSALPHPVDGELVYRSAVTDEADIRLAATPLEPRSPQVLLAMRVLVTTTGAVALEELVLPTAAAEALRAVIAAPYASGLVLLCGATGSGKSTTLAGAVGFHHALHGAAKNRLSMETPVERKMPGVLTQIHVPRERYAAYYPQIVRSDPDLLLLGEIRDQATASFGVDLANTGHLLLSTLHADRPAMALRALAARVDPFRHPELYASTRLLVGQRLVRGLCDCAGEHEPSDGERTRFADWQKAAGLSPQELPETLRAPTPEGCDRCRGRHHDGYRRMLPVNEVLPITAALRDRLIGGALPTDADHTLTFADSLRERLLAGEIDLAQVLTPGEAA